MNIDSLSWHFPSEEQRRHMLNMLPLTDEDAKSLILPPGKQDCWENCAVLLASLDDAAIGPILPRLFEWYKDLNWPGLDAIHERLLKLPVQLLEPALTAALHRAAQERDDEWADNLSAMFIAQESGLP